MLITKAVSQSILYLPQHYALIGTPTGLKTVNLRLERAMSYQIDNNTFLVLHGGDSNLHHWFRRLASYPLNDKSISELHCKGKMLISHQEISASLAAKEFNKIGIIQSVRMTPSFIWAISVLAVQTNGLKSLTG